MGEVAERQLSCLEINERWQGYKPEEVEPTEWDMKSDSRALTRHGGVSVMIGMWILKYMTLFQMLEIKSEVEYCHHLIKTTSASKNLQ